MKYYWRITLKVTDDMKGSSGVEELVDSMDLPAGMEVLDVQYEELTDESKSNS